MSAPANIFLQKGTALWPDQGLRVSPHCHPFDPVFKSITLQPIIGLFIGNVTMVQALVRIVTLRSSFGIHHTHLQRDQCKRTDCHRIVIFVTIRSFTGFRVHRTHRQRSNQGRQVRNLRSHFRICHAEFANCCRPVSNLDKEPLFRLCFPCSSTARSFKSRGGGGGQDFDDNC